MASPPAHCPHCGAFFPAPMQFQNVRNVTFSNVQVSCPRCGQMGKIPDGTYDFVGNAIQLLSGPATSAATLRQLSALLEAARARGDDSAALRSTLADQGDTIRSLADLLPSGRAELYAFIALILALIQLLLQAGQSNAPVTVEQVFNAVVQQSPTTPATPKLGRNDPCHCGSGKKYKNCHLNKE